MNQIEVLLSFTETLDKLRIPFFIGGSLASSLWGKERFTQDADLILAIGPEDAERLIAEVQRPWVLSVQSLRDAVESKEEFAGAQVLHEESLERIDLFVIGDELFGQSQLARAKRFEVFPGHWLPFASAEDTVISKLRWFDLGNRISDRQWTDIVMVLEIQGPDLDLPYMRKWATVFGLLDLLEEALSQVTPDSPQN